MRFSKDLVQRAKESTNIVDYVGRFVELKRTGKNYKGLCPFHKKKRLLLLFLKKISILNALAAESLEI